MRAHPTNPGERPVHVSTEYFRRPLLPSGVRYALLLRHDGRIGAKPLVFDNLGQLARSLHRRRAGAGLQLSNTELLIRGSDFPRQGVSIWTTDPSTGDARTFLGWAWLGGGGRDVLQFALRLEQHDQGDLEHAA